MTTVREHKRSAPYSRLKEATVDALFADLRMERDKRAEQALKKALPKVGAGISKALAEALSKDPEFARRIAEGG